MSAMTRREFVLAGGVACAALLARSARAASPDVQQAAPPVARRSVVHVTAGEPRGVAVRRLLALAGLRAGAAPVMVKANFVSDGPPPQTTHPEALAALLEGLHDAGGRRILLVERSGEGDTESNLRARGADRIARRVGARLVPLDRARGADWVHVPAAHWLSGGVKVARHALECPTVVTLSCLKTHAFGGVFTMSLKTSVGLACGLHMPELHTSVFSMRAMVAEIAAAYRPAWNIIDATEGFFDGGPLRGNVGHTGLLLASADRVALDAAGVALLKAYGPNRAIASRPVFAQDQIRFAAALGVGVQSADGIEIRAVDARAEAAAQRLRDALAAG
jgi:uncharacterized protein (DUF362 family)